MQPSFKQGFYVQRGKRVNSMNQKCLTQDINRSLQLDIEKTKLEMQFIVDVERKKTETNKQIIQQAFIESKDMLNEVTNKKIQILQLSNEETLTQLTQSHQKEILKLHQSHEQQQEANRKINQQRQEEMTYNYQNSLAQIKMQMTANLEYQINQYREQFQRERNEMNERHLWDIKILKEKQEEQIKAIIDRLNREYETKINKQLYQLSNHYETELDKLKQQLNFFDKQNKLNGKKEVLQASKFTLLNKDVQTEVIYKKEQYIQTDQIIQEINPTYYTDYEQLQNTVTQQKHKIFDLHSEVSSSKVKIEYLEQLVIKYQKIFE